MVANFMGDACASPSVVLRIPRSTSVVAEHHLCSLCKSLLSYWKLYPTFLILVLCFPLILMTYALLTLMLTLSQLAPLHLPATRWDLLCVCVLKTQCPKFALLLCAYSRPHITYSGVEIFGGTIRQLSGHPTFSAYSIFRGFALQNHWCQWHPIEIVWSKRVGLC